MHFFLLCAVLLFSAESFAFKGALGVGLDAGYANLPTANLIEPNSAHGIMSRLRTFYGISRSIGVELTLSNSFYGEITPVIAQPGTTNTGTAATTTLTPIERTQIREMSLGAIYVIDIYRVIPYFSVGLAKYHTRSRNVDQGASVGDMAAYVDAAVEYQFSKNVWSGVVGTFHFPFTSNSQFNGHMGVMLRLTYVWHTQKLNLPKKSVE